MSFTFVIWVLITFIGCGILLFFALSDKLKEKSKNVHRI
jgi:hypothetical protein